MCWLSKGNIYTLSTQNTWRGEREEGRREGIEKHRQVGRHREEGGTGVRKGGRDMREGGREIGSAGEGFEDEGRKIDKIRKLDKISVLDNPTFLNLCCPNVFTGNCARPRT